MPVIEATGGAAVERDGADAGMRVEQLGDRVRYLGADRRVGAGSPLAALDDVPQRDAAIEQKRTRSS